MNYEPNRWRVLEVDGEQKFYVFRNPPNAAFHVDEKGSRVPFFSRESAQAVVDELNAAAAH